MSVRHPSTHRQFILHLADRPTLVHIAADLPIQRVTSQSETGTMVQYKLAAAALLSLSATKAYVQFVSPPVSLRLAFEVVGGDGFSPVPIGRSSQVEVSVPRDAVGIYVDPKFRFLPSLVDGWMDPTPCRPR